MKENREKSEATEKRTIQREKLKRKQANRNRFEREKHRLQIFYLAHIVFFSIFLLAFGVYYAGTSSEHIGNGSKTDIISPADAQKWFQEKWDLFFDGISAKIINE